MKRFDVLTIGETLVDCIAQEKGIPLSRITYFKNQLFTIEKNYVIVNS